MLKENYYTDIKFPEGDIRIMVIEANALSLRRYVLKNLAVKYHYELSTSSLIIYK